MPYHNFGITFSYYIDKSSYCVNYSGCKAITMGNLLYTIAVILIIIWALGFFGVLGTNLAGNNLIHILLVIAIVAILLRVIRGRGV